MKALLTNNYINQMLINFNLLSIDVYRYIALIANCNWHTNITAVYFYIFGNKRFWPRVFFKRRCYKKVNQKIWNTTLEGHFGNSFTKRKKWTDERKKWKPQATIRIKKIGVIPKEKLLFSANVARFPRHDPECILDKQYPAYFLVQSKEVFPGQLIPPPRQI